MFSAAGANKQFINGSPTALNVLAALGDWLLDMHGPHEHQSLLHPAAQLSILDAYAGLGPSVGKYSKLAAERAGLIEKKAALIVDEKSYAQQVDLLRFQANEIESARLRPEEEESLESEHGRAANAARLLELAQAAAGALAEDEGAAMNQAGAVGRNLREMERLDSGAAGLVELHEQALGALRELQRELSHYVEKIEIDPARLSELEERVNLVQSLKRKYGSTLAEVIEFGGSAREKLEALESRDEEVARLNGAIESAEERLWEAGRELSERRRTVIPKLAKAVVKELRGLGFKQSSFEIAMSTLGRKEAFARAAMGSGLDTVEFQFAPNPGEPGKALRAIASSGELARVMLALKTVLAAEDQVPVLVFDEVDANVGGETAGAVGEKMRRIGERRQVLCITHLAPVAAAAGTHYVVEKEVREGRTFSSIEKVEGKRRVAELARMLGGQSEAARGHAEELLHRA